MDWDHSGQAPAGKLLKSAIASVRAGNLLEALKYLQAGTLAYKQSPSCLEWEAAVHWSLSAPSSAIDCWQRALQRPYQSLGTLPILLYFASVRHPNLLRKSVAIEWVQQHLQHPKTHSVARLHLRFLLDDLAKPDLKAIELPGLDHETIRYKGAMLTYHFLKATKALENGDRAEYFRLISECAENEYANKERDPFARTLVSHFEASNTSEP